MVVLQESSHLVEDVEPPVVQDLSEVGHAAHAHLLSCGAKRETTVNTQQHRATFMQEMSLIRQHTQRLKGGS